MTNQRNGDIWDLQGITFIKTLDFMDSKFDLKHIPTKYGFFDNYTPGTDPLCRSASIAIGVAASVACAVFALCW